MNKEPSSKRSPTEDELEERKMVMKDAIEEGIGLGLRDELLSAYVWGAVHEWSNTTGIDPALGPYFDSERTSVED